MVTADQLRSSLFRWRVAIYCVLGAFLLVILSTIVERRLSQWVLSELTEQSGSMQIAVSAKELSIGLFRLAPYLRVDQLSIAAFAHEPAIEHTDVEVSLNWLDLFKRRLTIRDVIVSRSRINLLVDDAGEDNWSPLIDALIENLNEDGRVVELVQLNIPTAELEYINDLYGHTGLLELQGQWNTDNFAVESNFSATGDINFLPVALEANLNSVLSKDFTPQSGTFKVAGKLDNLALELDAIADNLQSFENARLALSLEGQSLVKTLKQLNLPQSAISTVSIKGAAHYSEQLLNSEFDINLDNSSATAEFLVLGLIGNEESSGRKITGSVTAGDLYVDSIFVPGNEADEILISDQKTDDATRLFSSKPLLLDNPFDDIALDLSVSIASLYTGRLRVNELLASITANKSGLSVNLASDDVGKGRFSGIYSAKMGDEGLRGKLSTQVQRVPISDVMSLLDLPDGVASGNLTGDATFWITGKTEAELAGSLDGGMFLLIEDGKLDSLLVEMAGIDLMESVSLVVSKDLQQSDIRCGYMDIQADQGRVVLKDFIIDTEDSVFLASGQVNLGDEVVNIKFSPHPRDTSFFAATTPVHIVGPLRDPRIRPGKKLYTRLALAAAMAALAGPAAIVLPFVEMGDGGEKSYCSELFGK